MIGIGGIGMSALAQLFTGEGKQVSGSDREASPTTELLESKGVHVVIGQHTENVPADAELVVYSDAVPESNPERVRAKEFGIKQLSYFGALGEVSTGRTTIAVAGTHGKTTTTAMLTKILVDAGKQPTAVIGSIVRDFGSNFVSGEHELFVVEACEYKDHLLEITPKILVITNLEWDHTDYFHSLGALQETFKKAVARVPADGVIIANPNDANVAAVLGGAQAPVVDYTKETVPQLSLIGEFNAMNARAAAAAARALFPDISQSSIDTSLASFKGTWRRFEEKGTSKNGALVFDDYAHHPTAVRETIHAAKQKFADKKIVVAFHPHLYSRTHDLMDGFATAFDEASEVLLAPIYAAREEPIPGVTSEVLAQKIVARGIAAHAYPSLDAVHDALEVYGDDTLIITMGAGDIYKVADRLVQHTPAPFQVP